MINQEEFEVFEVKLHYWLSTLDQLGLNYEFFHNSLK